MCVPLQANPSQAMCDFNASSQAHAAKPTYYPTVIETDQLDISGLSPKLLPDKTRKPEKLIDIHARRNYRCVDGLRRSGLAYIKPEISH